MFVRLALGLFLSLAALPAVPHSENEGGPGYAVIDCEHPAANVATTLPEGIARPANLQCTPAFQQIIANEGWNWRYPGSFFDRPFIPAFAPKPSHGKVGPRFFTGFEAQELPRSDVIAQHDKFAKEIPTYREKSAPARILKLVATNDLGHELDAYFGFRSEREGWVVLCAPECAPENLFLFEKTE
ncbi:MAG TPA: hypothetical protein VEW72_05330 [Burkholderiales bacterium]|nr:hypothetical protein [Burkholderiales bacterium]